MLYALIYHIVICTILHSGIQLFYGAKICLIENYNFRVVFVIGGPRSLCFGVI